MQHRLLPLQRQGPIYIDHAHRHSHAHYQKMVLVRGVRAKVFVPSQTLSSHENTQREPNIQMFFRGRKNYNKLNNISYAAVNACNVHVYVYMCTVGPSILCGILPWNGHCITIVACTRNMRPVYCTV